MWCKWNSFVYQHFIYLISVCVRLLVHNIVKRWKCVFIQNSNKMTSYMLFVFWWPGIVCLQILCENREIHIPISCTENLQLHVCIKKWPALFGFQIKLKFSWLNRTTLIHIDKQWNLSTELFVIPMYLKICIIQFGIHFFFCECTKKPI